MNVEIRIEATQFLFGEYLNRIYFAVWTGLFCLGLATDGNCFKLA
jgi:hypothetical protein